MVRKFTTPNQRSSKIYQVSLDKNLKYEDLEKIQNGLTIEGHRVYVEEVTFIEGESKSEIGVKMKTSNVKVVRNIFEHLKYNVIKYDFFISQLFIPIQVFCFKFPIDSK
jgi:23S rRNA pseudouridine2605 synthase